MIDFVTQLLPVVGDRFRLELTEEEPRIAMVDGNLVATLRLSVFDENGSLRDLKEQTVTLLPARYQNERGRAFLEQAFARARELGLENVEYLMPHDLFCTELLAAPIAADAFGRVLDDARARAILDRRRDDERLLATLDPRGRDVVRLRNNELEAAIRDRLDDPAPYGVYGDWLAERGDPRGELIALQVAGRDATALIETYAWEWLGGLAWDDQFKIDWRFGFPRSIRIGYDFERPVDFFDVGDLLREIARAPGMLFVDTIEIGPHPGWSPDVFEAIGDLGLPSSTRRLAIQTPEHEHMSGIDEMYPKLQALHELRLESRSFDLGAVDLPNLRTLDLVTRGLTKENLEALREASWPALERLVVWIGDIGVDACDVELDDLSWLFDGIGLPAVKHLGLCGRADTSGFAERLLAAPILHRLDLLDLPQSGLKADELTALRAKFPTLSIVDDQRFIPCYE